MLVALHHAPPGFPCVFDAREILLYLVWRNATIRASPKYNNSFMERWYIGSGWTYKFEGKNVRYSGKNSGVYNFSSEKENQQAIILVRFKVPVEVSSYNYVQSKIFRRMFLCFSVECMMGWSRCQFRLRKNEPNQSTVFIFLVMFGGFPRSSFRSISVASFR